MKLLSRFKKTKVAPLTLEQKIQNLQTCTIEELRDIIASDEKRLQAGAIALLPYGEILKQLVVVKDESFKQHQAILRLSHLIDNDLLSFYEVLSDLGDIKVLQTIAGHLKNDHFLKTMIESLDEEHLFELCLSSEVVYVRQLAAEQLKNGAVLQRLLKEVKGKDKAVFKIVKNKLDFIKQQAKIQLETSEKISNLLISFEKHSKNGYDSIFEAKTKHLSGEWQKLKKDAEPTIAQEIELAFHVCEKIINTQAELIQEQKLQKLAIANSESEQQQILTESRLIIAALYSAETIESNLLEDVKSSVNSLKERWKTTKKDKKQSSHQALFNELLEAIEILLKQLIDFGTTLAHTNQVSSDKNCSEKIVNALKKRVSVATFVEDKPSDLTRQVTDVIKDAQKRKQEQQQNRKNSIHHLTSLVKRVRVSISKGKLREAAGIRKTLDKQISAFSDLPASLDKQIKSLDEPLSKLQDWQNYAVQPKKHELVEKMEGLVASTLPPEVLAKQIKTLQEQWKALSKGNQSQDEDLWKSFHSVAEKAYQPCKQHFEKLAELRRQNLDKRKVLTKQVEVFYGGSDWDNADWKKVQKILKVARDEWQSYSPVEHNENKKIQTTFDKVMDKIYQKLQEEYQKNAEQKQQLVEKAKHTLELENMFDATEQIKSLQQKWKKIGFSTRKKDQTLWTEFRKCCDKVFEKRLQSNKAHKEQQRAIKKEAEEICYQLQEICKLSGEELLNAKTQISQLKNNLLELEHLGHNEEKKFNQKFEKLEQVYQDKIEAQKYKEKTVLWRRLFELNDMVRLYLCEQLNEKTTGNKNEENLLKIQQSLTDTKDLPQTELNLIKEKIKNIQSIKISDLELNEAFLRKLCIFSEILNDVETPETDKKLRMSIQVERLQQGFGESQRSTDTKETLMTQWLTVGAVKSEDYYALFERFQKSTQ